MMIPTPIRLALARALAPSFFSESFPAATAHAPSTSGTTRRAAAALSLLASLSLAACGDDSEASDDPDTTAASSTGGEGTEAPTTTESSTTDDTASSTDDEPTGGQPPPLCGNGVVEDGEQCDDGLHNGDYDQCAADCSGLGPHCGDGIEDLGEECDDGNSDPLDGCAPTCHLPGSIVWDHTVFAPDGSFIGTTGLDGLPDGGVVAFFTIDGTGTSTLVRLDSEGEVVWDVPVGDEDWTSIEPRDINVADAAEDDHVIYVTGSYDDGGGDVALARWFDLDGNVVENTPSSATPIASSDVGPAGQRAIAFNDIPDPPTADAIQYWGVPSEGPADWEFVQSLDTASYRDLCINRASGDVASLIWESYDVSERQALILVNDVSNGDLTGGTIYRHNGASTTARSMDCMDNGEVVVVVATERYHVLRVSSEGAVTADYNLPWGIYMSDRNGLAVNTADSVAVGGSIAGGQGSVNVFRFQDDGEIEMTLNKIGYSEETQQVAYDGNGELYRVGVITDGSNYATIQKIAG